MHCSWISRDFFSNQNDIYFFNSASAKVALFVIGLLFAVGAVMAPSMGFEFSALVAFSATSSVLSVGFFSFLIYQCIHSMRSSSVSIQWIKKEDALDSCQGAADSRIEVKDASLEGLLDIFLTEIDQKSNATSTFLNARDRLASEIEEIFIISSEEELIRELKPLFDKARKKNIHLKALAGLIDAPLLRVESILKKILNNELELKTCLELIAKKIIIYDGSITYAPKLIFDMYYLFEAELCMTAPLVISEVVRHCIKKTIEYNVSQALKSLKSKVHEKLPSSNAAIGMSIEFRDSAYYPASMVGQLLPYLSIPYLTTLRLSDVGLRSPRDKLPCTESNGFGNEHKDALLFILSRHEYLTDVCINIGCMDENVQEDFVNKWKEIPPRKKIDISNFQ